MPPHALHQAVRSGKLDRVTRLLRGGADADARDAADLTPLMLAVCGGKARIIEALLARGADPDAATTERTREANLTLRDLGAPSSAGLRFLPTGDTALMLAAYLGKHQAAQQLLEAGAAVDPADARGWTPLLMAIYRGQRQVVGALLAHGAAADLADEDQRSPLMVAVGAGDLTVVQALLQAGADAASTNDHGESALTTALQQQRADMARTLRAAGAPEPPQPLAAEAALSPDEQALRDQLPAQFFLQLRAVVRELEPLPLLNGAMRQLGLRGIGDRWNRRKAGQAADLVTRLLSQDLPHGDRLLPADQARALADKFSALLQQPSAAFYTNISQWDADSRTSTPFCSAELDACVVGFDGQRLVALWTEQEY